MSTALDRHEESPHHADEPFWQGVSDSPGRTVALARALTACVGKGDLIALVGELGAGKTQFTRGLAQGLGGDPSQVASPTFVLVHEYPMPAGRPMLVHVDAYRLSSLDELESIGWDPAAGGGELRSQALLVVEWADRLGGTLGEDWLEVRLDHIDADQRDIALYAHGQWKARMPQILTLLAAWQEAGGASSPSLLESE